ncbi:MAG TPA: hypothetical protein VN257_11385, partial [Actinotalea sp.]|nr:hypothetical protein [Actinotalea sp.]
AARAWRSWSTDARYQSALVGAVLAPVAIVLLVATVVDAPAAVALSMGPLMAATIGWGRHNDLAFDGAAFWMHVVAAVPGRADRWGRTAAVLRWAVPVTVVVALVGAVVAGRADLAAASMGASFGLLGAGLAVSAVLSPVLPYSVPEAGSNPFATEMGSVGASLVAQLVSSAATLVVSLPVLVAFGMALWWDPAMAWVTLVLGLLGGAAVLAIGVRWGGRLYDERAVWLLARVR